MINCVSAKLVMLEPEIKFENCEEIYTELAPRNVVGEQHQDINKSSSELGGTGFALAQKRTYSEHLQSMVGGCGTVTEQYTNNSFQSSETPNLASSNYHYFGLQQQPNPHQYRDQKIQNKQKQQTPPDAKLKRRRYETNILFQHPFFNLLEDWDNARSGDAITAKCLSCKVTLRGHKNVSSNFIKHMKRLHPDLYKLYESYKLIKLKGWGTLEPLTGSSNMEQSYFDAGTFLEHMAEATGVEDHNSTETSSTTPTEIQETVETYNSPDPLAEERHPSKHNTAVGSAVRLVSQHKILVDAKQTSNPPSEVDLSAKTLAQMSQMLDSKLNGFVTISQLQAERKTMMELIDQKLETTASLSQTDNSEKALSEKSVYTVAETITMQSQIDDLKKECAKLRTAMQIAQKSKHSLQAELQAIDRTMRQRKLFARNVPMMVTEKPKQAAERLMRELLQLPDVQIKHAYLLSNSNAKNKPNLLIELQKAQDAKVVMSSCGRLKSTGIMLEHALGPHALQRKHKLLVLRREMLRRNTQLKVLVRNTNLIVGGKQFYWDAEEGLCFEGQLDGGDEGVVQLLKEITGLEMQEFLNVLKNYNVK